MILTHTVYYQVIQHTTYMYIAIVIVYHQEIAFFTHLQMI